MEFDELPSVEDVVRIYQERLQQDNEPPVSTLGSQNLECLDGVIGSTHSYAHWGEGIDLLHISACLLCKLAQRHCLPNANKRTAWDCAMQVLLDADLTIDESDLNVADFVLRVVNEGLEPNDVVVWMAPRLTARNI